MRRVGLGIDARPAAVLDAGVAAHFAGSVLAFARSVRRLRAAVAAAPAVLEIFLRANARVAARRGPAAHARDRARAVRTPWHRHRRRAAHAPTGAAVRRVVREVDARTGAVLAVVVAAAVVDAPAAGAHLVGGARGAASAAVRSAREHVDATSAAVRVAGVAARGAGPRGAHGEAVRHGGARLIAHAAVARVGTNVHARRAARGEAGIAAERAGPATNGAAVRRDRTRHVARAAVRWVRGQVRAGSVAVFAVAAVDAANARRADFSTVAVAATRAAVGRVACRIDTLGTATGEPTFADHGTSASDAARVPVRGLVARVVTLAAVATVRLRVGARSATSLEAIVAVNRARARAAHARAIFRDGAAGVAFAAVSVRRGELDARPVAVGRAARAAVGAGAAGAHLAHGAALVARPAMLRVASEVDARRAACRETGIAARSARSVHADGCSVGRRRAAIAARSAVRKVASEVDARSVACLETVVARVVAAAVHAPGPAARRGRAGGAASAAVFRVGVEERALSRAHRLALVAGNRTTIASPLGGANADVRFGLADVTVDAASGVVAGEAVQLLG